MINISNVAKKKILELANQEGIKNPNLRVVVGQSCCGYGFQLRFDDNKSENDQVSKIGKINLVMDELSRKLSPDVDISYEDGLEGRGFVITNPKAKSTCDCGRSFEI